MSRGIAYLKKARYFVFNIVGPYYELFNSIFTLTKLIEKPNVKITEIT